MNIWRHFDEQCNFCGDDVEVFTDEKLDEGLAWDGDPAKCLGCGATGGVSVTEEGDGYISWNEEEE